MSTAALPGPSFVPVVCRSLSLLNRPVYGSRGDASEAPDPSYDRAELGTGTERGLKEAL